MINYNDDKRIAEKFYSNDGSEKNRAIRIALIVILAAAALYGYCLWKENHRVPALPGEVILKGNMDIATADGLLQEAGYIPMDEVKTSDEYIKIVYEKSEAFDLRTLCSELAVSQSGSKGIYFVHYFFDSSEENNMDNPGERFNAIAKILTDKIGKSPMKTDSPETKGWTWEVDKKTQVHMTYATNAVFMVEYHYLK